MAQLLDLHDSSRGRDVRVCCYGEADAPVVLFSPGYGGARTGYSFLARHWAELGIATVVLEHPGSNHEALARLKERAGREFPRAVEELVASDREEFDHRLLDARFVQKVVGAVGLAGHSYGSTTMAALAAESTPLGLLLLSPPFPGGLSDAALARIEAPTMLITGTRDSSLTGRRTYQERLETFARLQARPRYLAVLEEAEHLTFAGIGLKLDRWLPSLKTLTGRFWESCFKGVGSVDTENLQEVCRWEAA